MAARTGARDQVITPPNVRCYGLCVLAAPRFVDYVHAARSVPPAVAAPFTKVGFAVWNFHDGSNDKANDYLSAMAVRRVCEYMLCVVCVLRAFVVYLCGSERACAGAAHELSVGEQTDIVAESYRNPEGGARACIGLVVSVCVCTCTVTARARVLCVVRSLQWLSSRANRCLSRRFSARPLTRDSFAGAVLQMSGRP